MLRPSLLLHRSLLVLFLFSPTLGGGAPLQQKGDYLYASPRPLDFARNFIPDEKDFFRLLFRKKSLIPIAVVAVATGLLIWKDQYIVDQSEKLGDQWHLSHDHDQTNRHGIHLGSQRLDIGLPDNWGQALYFLGDGWFYVGIGSGFLSYGLAAHDNRAKQTTSEMAESILTSGLIVQILKHITGRESPYTAEISGGRWRFFPNQIDYHKNVAKHDAFPSGHLAAGSAALTVISSNYSEYKFITPLGITLLTMLSFQMMNNSVHWAADYPLSIALGYGFGKIAVNKGRKKKEDSKTDTSSVSLGPVMTDGGMGLGLRYRF